MKRFLLSFLAIVAILVNAQEKTVFEGSTVLTWGQEGQIAIPAAEFEGLNAGSLLAVSYTQVDQQWDQAQVNYGDWSNITYHVEGWENPDSPDGSVTGSFVPTSIYGWFSDGILDRTTSIILSQEILDNIQAKKGDYYGVEAGVIIQGSGLTVTKIVIIASEGEDLTGDIVGNYTFDYAASSIYGGTRAGAKVPVTIEKATNSTVTIKGLGHDFVASILANGNLYVDKQNYPYTTQTEAGNDTIVDFIISGRTVATWETYYDEQGNWAGGGYSYTYADSTAFILQNGFYTLPDGIQIGDSFIKDGILLKEGNTLPGDLYTIVINAYENTGFDVEKMQPIAEWSVLSDTLNFVTLDNKVQLLGLFGLGIVELDVLADGSLSYPTQTSSDPFMGPWADQGDGNWAYSAAIFTPIENGYFADGSAIDYSVLSYAGATYLIKGEVDPTPIASGIKTLATATAPAALDFSKPVYNVAGQRVDASAKGILIQNGKKYFVK